MAHKTTSILTSAILALALVGCGFEDVGTNPPGQQPPHKQPPANNNNNNNNNNTGKTQRPTVDAMSATTCTKFVAVRGKAPAGADILITGGTGDIAATPNGISGQYCANVGLKLNQPNTLQIFAHDPLTGLSDPISVKITQMKCNDDVNPTTPADQPKSKNVALGMKGKAKISAESGNEDFVTDGKSSTVAVYNAGWGWGVSGSADLWVSVKLDKLVEAEKIVVKWRDSKGSSNSYYGYKYRVLVATGSTPTDPNIKDGYWTEVGTVTDGDGGIDLFDLKNTKPLVQHVALWLEKDGASSWSHYFALAEIEVWDSPKKKTPAQLPKSNACVSQ